jgi:hypothetical protein
VKPSKPLFSASQNALLGVGILLFVSSVAFRKTLSEAQFVGGLSMGFFFVVFGLVLPATQTK